ncbi:hypothetical protein PG991_006725 [Apiospora marii]|uniref:AMP-dependent synthetase/ligase domain-containing protein n=1 Tax=Apiospora marii TaxID=335849 RepID=A0ABR1RZY3_9PEZI
MDSTLTYSLADVLAVAKVHPFYSNSQYPPSDEAIREIRRHASLQPIVTDLRKQPLLFKEDLYIVTERLIHDTSPQNTYRNSAYTSVTGGGGNSKPLFFATDALENRRQRARFGQFLRNLGLIQPGDWVLTTHVGGDLYRSLDLMLEVTENAGATSLAAGHLMPTARVVQLLQDFHINVLTGDGSQIIQVVHCISSLRTGRDRISLEKIIYTSEALSPVQKSYIRDVLGAVKICSILGSAEAGPYGASSPDLNQDDPATSYTDFIFDSRTTLIEVFPLSFPDAGGSIQPLPAQAHALIPKSERVYMRLLRLHGRDACSSFTWDGEYIELDKLAAMLARADLGIVQWQVVLDRMMPSNETSLEIRLLCVRVEEGNYAAEKTIAAHIRNFFYLHPVNEHRFKLTFVEDRAGFELSRTGRKIAKLIDRSGI